ncbi:uncharacterized protein LOC116307022 [Actinia tenebrosa]|uniref:Uncharacterized protein LOC116307022 n=1 Tax=Actinia tenebrosa TaxID=6105 RepID=A0A6P8J0N4_ACTTE|nr:uncharacterized protein LOC116307022 [Actinia tenebrosa]
MKFVLGIPCILLATLPQVVSLKCFVGINSNYKEETCPSGLDTCSLLEKKPLTARACMMKDTCDQVINQCKATGLCQMKCCQTDLCNKSYTIHQPFWHFLLKYGYVLQKK